MDTITSAVFDGVVFGRTALGLLFRPYETYRRIADRGKWGEIGVIAVVLGVYFALASVVKVSSFRPFLLTRQFVLLYAATAVGYIVAVGSLWLSGRVFNARVRLLPLAVAWGYTLIPTVSWFLVTSLLYVVLPPPRTTSLMGVTFSVLFIIFSATLLWWKLMLSYLTVRFVLKLDFPRIFIVCILAALPLTAYSVLMYSWGIFKIPFL